MRKVDWTKWSSIAEILGAIAIVATLAYLAIQTQQNTNALIAVSRQAALQAELDSITFSLEFPQTRPDPDLTPEAVRRSGYIYQLRIREFEWFQYRSGILDEATWQSYLGATRRFATGEPRAFLENNYVGDPEFKAYLIDWLDSEAVVRP